ncbi:MAG: methyl-accepting chemotaxis protein [Thermosynechococcaceae cyanobacterium MS004]|nr:methyl-accepting chemotaxis protein [Thermosynechococcaceae cyanobacterium MS004]
MTSVPLQPSDSSPEAIALKSLASSSNADPLVKARQFVRSNLVATITVTLTSSLLLTGASTWNLWNIYKGFRSTVAKQFQLERSSGQIVHLDEVLTMSARMAASTGDTQWETRYNEFVPKLDKAIESTLAGVSDSIRAEASKTDEANKKLIDWEAQAFKLVRQGKAPEALKLLLGPEYSTQKAAYKEGSDKVLALIEASIQQQLRNYEQSLLTSITFAAVLLPVLLASWLLVLSAVRDYIQDRQIAQAKLQKSQENLLAVNEALKVEADSRQQQEALIRQESEQLQEDIGELLDVVCSIEEGDFTVQAEVNERATGLVGDTLNRLVEELGRVLSQVSLAAERVALSSDRQKNIASTVAQSTSDQALSVTQVLSLTETVRRSANSAAQQLAATNASLLTLQNAVTDGQITVGSLNQGIGVLQQGSDRMVQQIKTLGEFVGLADQFVQDQGDIATQTQVLALNASLVAARAAEQRDPKQFVAVAREFESIAGQVSQLAQQTNEGLASLEQRSAQIHRVVTDVDAEVQRLGALVNSFTDGVKQTREVFQTVQSVTGQAVASGETVAQTSQAIVETSDATATAVNAITSLSRQIAAQSEEANQISDQMNYLSANLLQSIQVFKLPTHLTEGLEATTLEGQVLTLDSDSADLTPSDAESFIPALVGKS